MLSSDSALLWSSESDRCSSCGGSAATSAATSAVLALAPAAAASTCAHAPLPYRITANGAWKEPCAAGAWRYIECS